MSIRARLDARIYWRWSITLPKSEAIPHFPDLVRRRDRGDRPHSRRRRLCAQRTEAARRVSAAGIGTDAHACRLSVARGAHIVKAVGSCTLCHGDDLGGAVYADMGMIGVIAGPNLTRGRGGRPADFTLADWVRALRFGVRRDGTSLIAMPSEVFTSFTDDDLASSSISRGCRRSIVKCRRRTSGWRVVRCSRWGSEF